MLTVNNLKGLRQLANDDYNAICFDDCKFQGTEKVEFRALFSTDQEKDIRVCYDNVTRRKGMIQIVTCSWEQLNEMIPELEKLQYNRRVRVFILEKGFMKESDETNGNVTDVDVSKVTDKKTMNNITIINVIVKLIFNLTKTITLIILIQFSITIFIYNRIFEFMKNVN